MPNTTLVFDMYSFYWDFLIFYIPNYLTQQPTSFSKKLVNNNNNNNNNNKHDYLGTRDNDTNLGYVFCQVYILNILNMTLRSD